MTMSPVEINAPIAYHYNFKPFDISLALSLVLNSRKACPISLHEGGHVVYVGFLKIHIALSNLRTRPVDFKYPSKLKKRFEWVFKRQH